VNDEFAKSFGNFTTLAELREHLRKNKREEKEREEKERFELAMLEKIFEVSQIEDVPDTLVNGELNKMVDELKSSISYQGMDFARYLESIKKTEEDMRKDLQPQAERRIKLSLVTRAISGAEHIEVSEMEVKKEIDDTKKLYENNAEITQSLASPEYFSYVKNVLSSKKVYAHLNDLMGGNEKKPSTS
jgi:trigger factor